MSSKKSKSLAPSISIKDDVKSLGANLKSIANLKSNPHKDKHIEEWYLINASENGLSGDTEHAGPDFFLNWSALDMLDAIRVYGYAFVIYDSYTGSVLSKLVLELNPQNINIEVPAAVNTTVTMNGIVEEHNAAPLRRISISGTTGVYADHITKPKNTANNVLNYIFRNTIKSALGVVNQAKKTIGAFTGKLNSNSNSLNISNSEVKAGSSGYEQIHNIARFFDYYLALKKQGGNNKKYRLSFEMYKDKMYYDVTLNGYSIRKIAGSLEYEYSIQVTAWKRRVAPTGERVKVPLSLPTKASKLNAVARIINGLAQSRRLIASVNRVLMGVRSDIRDVLLNPLKDVILFGKDLVGLSKTMADFYGSLWAGVKQDFLNTLQEAGIVDSMIEETTKVNLPLMPTDTTALAPPAGALFNSLIEKENSGKSDSSFETGDSADPVENLFNNPIDYVDIFDQIQIDNMVLSDSAINHIETEMERIRNYTADDLRRQRNLIASFLSSACQHFGGGSETVNRIRGLEPPKKVYKKLTTDDISILNELNNILQGIDSMIALVESLQTDFEDYYTFYRDYAVSEGLNFNDSSSKFFVPFPYGATLESLAVQYLGSADRWVEIAALNCLKPPYIDEEGFEYEFIASGAGNVISLSNYNNLFIGQLIEIYSDTQPKIRRKITNIDIVSSVETLIQVDGEPNLSIFKVSENAKIRAFLPNTVNSSKLIAIPSDTPTRFEGKLKITPTESDLNILAKISKTDFLLKTDGDIALSSGGDVKLAMGMTNIIQAALIKLQTKNGSMVQHPDFGSAVEPGGSTAEYDAKEILNSLDNSFKEDPRFSGVLAAEIKKVGPAFDIKLLLGIANTDITLPIQAQLPI